LADETTGESLILFRLLCDRQGGRRPIQQVGGIKLRPQLSPLQYAGKTPNLVVPADAAQSFIFREGRCVARAINLSHAAARPLSLTIKVAVMLASIGSLNSPRSPRVRQQLQHVGGPQGQCLYPVQ